MRFMLACGFLLHLCSVSTLPAADAPQPSAYFRIQVVDQQTGRGVPLVELKTTNDVRYYSDSGGNVAFYEPGLMGQELWFHVKSPGYEYPKDGFGYTGVRLTPKVGETATVKLKRLNIAERLYRITGGGIYRDTVLLGLPAPIQQPVLNGQVFGSDSVLNAIYQGRLFWIWGDTNRPAYPLGNFYATAATSRLPAEGGLDPNVGVDLTYFVGEGGFAKSMAKVCEGGPTWLDTPVTLRDADGREHLLAAYAKVRPSMEAFERGFVEFNDSKLEFEKVRDFDPNAPNYPAGHALRVTARGTEYCYFSRGLPLSRVQADREHFLDIGACEAYTCLQEGTRPEAGQIDRDPNGAIRYTWKRNTPALYVKELADLVKAGHLKPEEGLLAPQDPDTGKPVCLHGGSATWNAYRHRWVLISTELFGTSMLGELWYQEADTPLGPWVYARKILTHEKYSFYNPRQHPEFEQEGGRILYFEGTYTATFSGNEWPTPWYDYNQIMYKLDLDDPRLVLPVPIYEVTGSDGPSRYRTRAKLPADLSLKAPPIAFFACERAAPGVVAMQIDGQAPGKNVQTFAPTAPFYALPPDTKPVPPTAVPLYAFYDAEHLWRAYRLNPDWQRPGFVPEGDGPACYVWRNPLGPAIRFDLTAEQPVSK
jgi:hypothetical protein